MKTDDMIKKIASSAKPIKKLGTPLIRFLKFIVAAALCVGVGIAVGGFRHDIGTKLSEPMFILEALIILFLVISSAAAALVISMPNTKQSLWAKRFPFVPLLVWLGFLAFELFFVYRDMGMDGFMIDYGMMCVRDILLLAVVPGLVLFFMIQKAAPTKLGLVGVLILLAVAALGAMGTQFMCSISDPLHILLWHFVPVLSLGGIGLFLGRMILRW